MRSRKIVFFLFLTLISSYPWLGAEVVGKKALTEINDYKTYLPPFEDVSFSSNIPKLKSDAPRKPASQLQFTESDMDKDMIQLRNSWLSAKTGEEVEKFIAQTKLNFDKYSPEAKYFLAQLHTLAPLRGIVWKIRPVLEGSKGFLGTKMTHVYSIQLVRNVVGALQNYIPTEQTTAMVEYFTQPSVNMSKSDQFTSIPAIQNYLLGEMVPAVYAAITKISPLARNLEKKYFIWDNKFLFGTGTFEDEIHRYVGHGPAEFHVVLAGLFRSIHDMETFCAYNIDSILDVSRKTGEKLGFESTMFFNANSNSFGITVKEKNNIIKSANKKGNFLNLRTMKGSPNYGKDLMMNAFLALKNSVYHIDLAYNALQGRDNDNAMAINPVLFQAPVQRNLGNKVANMKALFQGATEVRDPISGEMVTVDMPNFYKNPPMNLTDLMATDFKHFDGTIKIKNKSGELLEVRNYDEGRSAAFSNTHWKSYVPSAAGKKPDYMLNAVRVIRFSMGTSAVFPFPQQLVY